MVVFVQSQQPLEDLDAQLRRALSPEAIAVTSAVGVSFENLDKIFPTLIYSWNKNGNLDVINTFNTYLVFACSSQQK